MTDGNHIFLIDIDSEMTYFDPVTCKFTYCVKQNHLMNRCPFSIEVAYDKVYIMEQYRNRISGQDMIIFDIYSQSFSRESPLSIPTFDVITLL